MIIDGIEQGTDRTIEQARPCEWCGEPMIEYVPGPGDYEEGEPRFASHPPMGGVADRKAHHPMAIFVTCLCEGCFGIYSILGRDGVLERPGR